MCTLGDFKRAQPTTFRHVTFDNATSLPAEGAERNANASARGLAGVAAFGAYLIIACLVFWPVGPFDQTHLPGGGVGDPSEMTWFLAWTPWAILHGHNFLLTHAIDLPRGVNLANNTSVPLLGLIGAPITLTLGPIATLNALLRLALAASATGLFLVTRRWCHGSVGPFIAGLVFAFSPALVSHLQGYGHLDLVFLPALPVILWLLVEIVYEQQRSPRAMGALLGAAAAAEYLISAELLADAAMLALVGGVVLVVAERSRLKPRLGHIAVAGLFGVGVFIVICAYPIAVALIGPAHLSGPVQSIAHLQRFRVDLLALVVPDSHLWIFPHAVASTAHRIELPITKAGGAAELSGYLGLPLLITTLALAIRYWRSRMIRVAATMAAICVVFSLGSRLEIGGTTTAIPLPEAVLTKLPLLSSIVPARFSIFTLLFAAVLLAVGFDAALVARRTRNRFARVGPVLCALGVGASILALAPRLPVSSEQPAETLTAAHAIATIVPRGSVLLTYPYPDPPFSIAMLWQARDGFAFSLLGGYANIRSRSRSGAGQLFPLLTTPTYVQEFLVHAESGRRVHFPLPGAVASPTAALCTFLARNHVTGVLYEPFGPGSSSVFRLFSAALGRPTARAAAFSFWRLSSSGCSTR